MGGYKVLWVLYLGMQFLFQVELLRLHIDLDPMTLLGVSGLGGGGAILEC